MAQATITPLNFIGRELIATDEPGRFRMGEITELNRESVTNALEEQELSQVRAIEETEPGIFILTLDVWDEVRTCPALPTMPILSPTSPRKVAALRKPATSSWQLLRQMASLLIASET